MKTAKSVLQLLIINFDLPIPLDGFIEPRFFRRQQKHVVKEGASVIILRRNNYFQLQSRAALGERSRNRKRGIGK